MTDMDLRLVIAVEKNPVLYDNKHAKNKDKSAIESAWEAISSDLGISAKECADRWLSLRSRFSKERGKIVRNGKTCDWPLMEHLIFLNNHVRRRRSFGIPLRKCGNALSTVKSGTSTDEDEDTSFVASTIENIEVTPISPEYSAECKRTKFSLSNDEECTENQLDEFVKIVRSRDENPKALNDDQYLQNFCDSLVSDLKCIPNRRNLLKCKIELMQVIEKYLN